MRSEFVSALESGNVRAVRRASAKLFPHLPETSPEQAEIAMHYARTQAEAVGFKFRAYSHRWLTERSLPSGLPDALRPSAERMYPVVVEAVGISCNAKNPYFRPVVTEVRKAMEHAVEDCFANGDRAPAIVSKQMEAARERTFKALLG